MDSYSEAELRSCLSDLGVKKGDCLFIHSGLKALGKFLPENSGNRLEALLNVFLETVGHGGTIVVPTFNFGFCHGEAFDLSKTPGEGMGIFSEYVRLNKSAIRVSHPFHSIAAIGSCANKIINSVGFSEFSDGSFFDSLLKLDCKIIFYGVNFVETFVHIAEERSKVPYRSWKTFTGEIINGEIKETVTINFYARKLDLGYEPLLDVEKINQYLKQEGIILARPLGSGSVSICNSNSMVSSLICKFRNDPYFALTNKPPFI